VAAPSEVRLAKPARAVLGTALLAALFLAVAALAYAPALRGALLRDDDAHVTRPDLRSLHGLWRIWSEVGATQQYYPVLHSAFWLEHRAWGDSVLGYHLLNVALHAGSAWLLALILRRLAFPAPVLAGLLFALHPVCVESVAWIAEQKNTLSALLYLLAALAYLGFDETRGPLRYVSASLLFLAALLTKSVTATLPAALLVAFWWRRGNLGMRRDVVPLLPWFAVAAVSGLLTAWIEAKLIGAEGAAFTLGALGRVLLAGRVVVFYAASLAWPSHLAFIYPRWTVDAGAPWQYAFPAAVLGVLAALVALSGRSRGPLAGFLFYTGTLFPALGFVNVYPFAFSFVADHFQYLASVGVLVPAAWAIDFAATRALGKGPARAAVLLAVPAVLGCITWRQCRIYRDPDTLNRATLAQNPSAWLAHYNLAVSLGGQPSGLDGAIAEYEAALRLNPDHWAARNNLGSAYLRVPGRLGDAVAQFEAPIRLKADFAEGHNNLGIALGRMPGRTTEAIAHLKIALRIRPDYDGALNNLGVLLSRDPGSLGEAVAEYRAAIGLDPGYVEAHSNLGAALARLPGACRTRSRNTRPRFGSRRTTRISALTLPTRSPGFPAGAPTPWRSMSRPFGSRPATRRRTTAMGSSSRTCPAGRRTPSANSRPPCA
jgi:tetratricopeptide (TPR) repeat protein